MDLFIFSKEKYPKPLDKNGDYSDTPYFLTVPNSSYLEKVHDLFPIFDETTMIVSALNPTYPKYENGELVETSIDEYKLAGLIPLEEYELIYKNKIVFTKEHQTELDAKLLEDAKTSKISEMNIYRKDYKERKLITFTHNEIDYLHGITDEDINNVTSTITTLNEVKSSMGIDDTVITWKFKEHKYASLMREDVVKLGILIQMTNSRLFEAAGISTTEIQALTSLDAVNKYDVRVKFDVI